MAVRRQKLFDKGGGDIMSKTRKITHPDDLIEGEIYEVSYSKRIFRIEFLALITKRKQLFIVGFDDFGKRLTIHWLAIRGIEQCT